jgi:hypothetical protein
MPPLHKKDIERGRGRKLCVLLSIKSLGEGEKDMHDLSS